MEKEILSIPFVAHESAMNRMERTNKRLTLIIIIMFVLFMIYLFLPTEMIEETTQDVNDIDNSEIHQNIGG